MLKKAVFVLAVLAGTAKAETLTCPVGGERFAAFQAAPCTETTGLPTMLLAPSRCAPPPMPQCPQNFLPMYRGFTAEELPLLKQYMQTESYESIVDFSPYFLAYNIEKYLSGPDTKLPIRLLLLGVWQNPALLFEDPDYVLALEREVHAQLQPSTADENALLLGMLAFAKWIAGDRAAASEYLARAQSENAQDLTVGNYLVAVNACFTDQSLPFCTATAAIPQP